MTEASTLAPLASLHSLQRLRLALSSRQQSPDGWAWLRSMPRLTHIHLSNDGVLHDLCTDDVGRQCSDSDLAIATAVD